MATADKLAAYGDEEEEEDEEEVSGSETQEEEEQRLRVCTWSLVAYAGAVVAGVLLILFLHRRRVHLGVAGLSSALYTAWIDEHMEATCYGVHGAKARRLWTEDSEEELEAAKAMEEGRELRPAKFNPAFLYFFRIPAGQYGGSMGLERDTLMPYYASADVQGNTPNDAEVAIIVFHGYGRNAQDYLCSVKKIVEESVYDRKRVMVIVPKYHARVDFKTATELWWNNTHPWGDWRGGAASDARCGATISSFKVVERMMIFLGNKDRFPFLRRIVLLGHSAGGQTVQRFGVLNHLFPNALAGVEVNESEVLHTVRKDLPVVYVVANPSSWAYLDQNRWAYDWNWSTNDFTEPVYAKYDPELGREGWTSDRRRRRNWGKHKRGDGWGWGNSELQNATPESPFLCKESRFNDWHYGINWNNVEYGNIVWYMKRHPCYTCIHHWYSKRKMIYLVGQNDTCTDDMLPNGICNQSCWTRSEECRRTAMDVKCSAMLQGPNRNVRARLFMQHLEKLYGMPTHRLMVVPGVGHEAERLFMSLEGQTAIWGEGSWLDDWQPE